MQPCFTAYKAFPFKWGARDLSLGLHTLQRVCSTRCVMPQPQGTCSFNALFCNLKKTNTVPVGREMQQ